MRRRSATCRRPACMHIAARAARSESHSRVLRWIRVAAIRAFKSLTLAFSRGVVLLLLTVKSPVCGTRVMAAYGFPFGTKSSKKTHEHTDAIRLSNFYSYKYKSTDQARSVRKHSGHQERWQPPTAKTFTTRSLRILSTHRFLAFVQSVHLD